MTDALRWGDADVQINGRERRTLWLGAARRRGRMLADGLKNPAVTGGVEILEPATTRIEATIMHKPSQKVRDAGFILLAVTLVLVLPNLPGLFS